MVLRIEFRRVMRKFVVRFGRPVISDRNQVVAYAEALDPLELVLECSERAVRQLH